MQEELLTEFLEKKVNRGFSVLWGRFTVLCTKQTCSDIPRAIKRNDFTIYTRRGHILGLKSLYVRIPFIVVPRIDFKII